MIDIMIMAPIARKAWVQNKWKVYEKSEVYAAMANATKQYEMPCKDEISAGKWKVSIDRKINYLFARPPAVTGLPENDKTFTDYLDRFKAAGKSALLNGSCGFINDYNLLERKFEPVLLDPKETLVLYTDTTQDCILCVIRKWNELSVNNDGEESSTTYFDLFFKDHKWTFCYEIDNKDSYIELDFTVKFFEVWKCGNTPLYHYADTLLKAYEKALRLNDKNVETNTDPLYEVKNYSGTDDDDLAYQVKKVKIVKVDGNGGVVVHTVSMDSASTDLWQKRLLQEFYEVTATVGKENELAYAQSGKALDRLFIDMENSARELASALEKALKAFYKEVHNQDIEIIWNTDRPVDDLANIQALQASKGLISNETILEQHPLVTDIEEEKRRIKAESLDSFSELNFEDAHSRLGDNAV